MTPFEFAVTFFSILFSIALAHMLQSLAELVRAGRRVRVSWVHATWMLSVLLCVVANWLSLWSLRTLREWSTGYVLLLTLAVIVQYIACVLVSPSVKEDGPVDLQAFHRQQSPKYLLAFGLQNVVSIPLNLVTASLFGVTAWGWQNLAQAPAAALTLLAIVVRPRWAQRALAVAVLILSVVYLAGLQDTVG